MFHHGFGKMHFVNITPKWQTRTHGKNIRKIKIRLSYFVSPKLTVPTHLFDDMVIKNIIWTTQALDLIKIHSQHALIHIMHLFVFLLLCCHIRPPFLYIIYTFLYYFYIIFILHWFIIKNE